MSSRAAMFLFVVWSLWVALTTLVGIGFAGGIREAFVGNPFGILYTVSPLVPLAAWAEARRRERSR